MITAFEFENWKSYSAALLYIDSLSVLIGTNASGKSNALDGLQLLNRSASGAMLTSALQGDSVQSPMRGGIEWAAHRPGNHFALGVTCRVDDATDYDYRLECRIIEMRCEVFSEQLVRKKYRLAKDGTRRTESGKINLFRTEPCQDDSPTIIARTYNGKNGSPRQLGRGNSVLSQLGSQRVSQEIEDGLKLTLADLRNIFLLDPIPSHMRSFSPLSDKLESDARNIAGVIAALPATERWAIEQTLTEYATQLPERDFRRVTAEAVGKFRADAMLYCEELWGDSTEARQIDARGMSDGTLRFLAILTALLTRPKGSLLVIEEVDNGLHPSRSKLLLEMLRNVGGQRSIDVLVTTHNPALLDSMGVEMVPFITVSHRDLKKGDSLLTLLEDVSHLAKLLAYGPVGRLSSAGLIEDSFKKDKSFEAQAELPYE